MVAAGGKAGEGGAKGVIQVGLGQGLACTVAFRQILVESLIAHLTIGGGQSDGTGSEIDGSVDRVVGTANIQGQNAVNVDPHVVVARKLEGNVVALGVHTVIRHLEADVGDHTKAILHAVAGIVGIAGRVDLVRRCVGRRSRRITGHDRTAQAIEGSKAGDRCGSSGVAHIPSRLVGNQHGAVRSAGTVAEIHSVLVAVQLVIAGRRIIDEGNPDPGVNAGVSCVAAIRGEQLGGVHSIAEGRVAALAEPAGGQPGVDVVVLCCDIIAVRCTRPAAVGGDGTFATGSIVRSREVEAVARIVAVSGAIVQRRTDGSAGGGIGGFAFHPIAVVGQPIGGGGGSVFGVEGNGNGSAAISFTSVEFGVIVAVLVIQGVRLIVAYVTSVLTGVVNRVIVCAIIGRVIIAG